MGRRWSAFGLLLALLAHSAVAETIQLRKHVGGYLVTGRINDAVSVDFVLDTGASDVLIPEEVAQALVRAGKLDRGDYLGTRTYVLADGSRVPSKRILLRQLTVGGQTVNNVTASIGRGRSQPLLGQSFLSKFPSWTLDNERHVLVLASKGEPAGGARQSDPGRSSGGSSYGAFAHDDQTGRYGLSWNQESAAQADQAALKGCAAEKCRIVFRTAPRQCGAIATNANGKIWGGATRPRRAAAEQAAVQNCEKRTSGQCTLRGSQCNG
jgi:clan AA aspartic protease (TIGR02281 family)